MGKIRSSIPCENHGFPYQVCKKGFVMLHLFRYLNRLMTKPTKWLCAQRRLRPAWASSQSDQESLLCTQWVAKDQSFFHADSKDSDQTGWMPMLICVFAGHTAILFVLSWSGSFAKYGHKSLVFKGLLAWPIYVEHLGNLGNWVTHFSLKNDASHYHGKK